MFFFSFSFLIDRHTLTLRHVNEKKKKLQSIEDLDIIILENKYLILQYLHTRM